KQKIKCFNLFASRPPTNDQHEQQNQLLSTRLFIILFACSLVTLVIYTLSVNRTQTITVKSLTLKEYTKLLKQYPQTLSCPCTQITIPYGQFIKLSPKYHQICSSQFIMDQWFQFIIESRPPIDQILLSDFRYLGPYSFRLLNKFCKLSLEIVENELIAFYSQTYLSSLVTINETLQFQSQSLIKQFQSTIKNKFYELLQLILDTTLANKLISGLLTNNAIGIYYGEDGSDENISSNTFIQTIFFPMPYSLMYYTLIQFSMLLFYMNATTATNITILDPSVPSQYQSNTTVQDIVNQLMIEQWNPLVSYDSSYQQCHPQQCQYTYSENFDYIYTITIILILIVGLTTVLSLIIPIAVNLIRRKKMSLPTTVN
ncbi:unnamed protein product, partial [Didymodactylos carnosus]